ncbi:uncharacterized protein LTR77_000089 [Saxophila tyrrhenica]|uniref:Uncharacterized protein n=1 Tax=Saxophila tyrrhenica TaxID=1690608 RepID=A0AAV9PRI6_9PEZI|nr:hypothetical protein LTR77_000089 [Saxophila tyrrhenica]
MTNNCFPPPTLGVRNDPGSFEYFRSYDAQAVDTPEERTARPGFWRRLFHRKAAAPKATKTSKAGFYMPDEPKNSQADPAQSFVRSRPNLSTNMTDNSSTTVPDIAVTRPSINGKRTTYGIHNWAGEGSPAVSHESVRFSHPAVNSVRPITPMSISVADKEDAASFRSSPPSDEDSPPSSRTSLVDDKHLRPTHVWRHSSAFNTADGERTSYHDFKNRLDGHKPPSSGPKHASVEPDTIQVEPKKVSAAPPSLQFITSVGEFTIANEPVFSEDAVFDVDEPTHVEKNRESTFNKLKSGNAVPVTETPHPAVLLPAQYPQALYPGQRPFSLPTTTGEKTQYTAYKVAPTIAAVMSEKAQGKQPAANVRPPTPDFEPILPDHRRHYARVESGIFDDLNTAELLNNPPPLAAAPPKAKNIPRRQTQLKHEPQQATSSTTPGPSKPRKQSKPLPPTPHKMNSNRYPMIDPATARTYSAEPQYQRRSVDWLEAKFRREQAAKTGKSSEVGTSSAIGKEEQAPAARPMSAGTLDKMILTNLQKQSVELERKQAHDERKQAEVAARLQERARAKEMEARFGKAVGL